MDQSDARLFRALAKAAERCVGEFIVQELANTAWAFSKVGQLDAQQLKRLTMLGEQCIGNFNVHELQMTFWS